MKQIKTPEQLAEEFFENWQPEKPKYKRPKARQYALEKITECFLAGYQAAKDEDEAKVQELEANWKFCCEDKVRLLNELAAAERAKDQLADADKVMNSPKKLDSWISVKERLPEYTPMVLAMCTDGYELAYYGMYGQGWTNTLGTEHLNVTHWHPLPKPPEDK